MTDFDTPEGRAALIERVGPEEYNRLHAQHRARSTLDTVNGHAIRRVGSQFGPLYAVGGTGHAFRTMDEARDFARTR